MTRPSQARLDFILQFVSEYPQHGREACVKAAGELMRLAKRRDAVNLAESSGPPEPRHPAGWVNYDRMRAAWDASIARRKGKLNARIHLACGRFGLPARINTDPRGPALRVLFPSGRGNCIGNTAEYAVPR